MQSTLSRIRIKIMSEEAAVEERGMQATVDIMRDMEQEGLKAGRGVMLRMWGVMGRRGTRDMILRLSLLHITGVALGDDLLEGGRGRVIRAMIGRPGRRGWYIEIDWAKEDKHEEEDSPTGGARI